MTTAFKQFVGTLFNFLTSGHCSIYTQRQNEYAFCSWRVLDVSVAMAYSMLTPYGKANRSFSAAAAMLRGFNSMYQLTDTERKHLVLLIACRLACSVTLGAYSLQQNPDNKYLLLHSEPAWKALELVWGDDIHHRATTLSLLNDVFDRACLHVPLDNGVSPCDDLVTVDPSIPKA